MKFYVNKQNGNVAVTDDSAVLNDSAYTLLNANTTDAAQEKHVPVVKIEGDTVTVDVGSVPHPMTEAHLISFIALETSHGYQLRKLDHTVAPKADFKLSDGEKPIAAYEYCNLHGLWVNKL